MSGFFTSLMYDQETLKDAVNRSTQQMRYKLNPISTVNIQRCPDDLANVGNKIDLDSALRGLKVRASKSNAPRPPIIANFRNCKIDPINQINYSRYIAPANELKGMTIPELHFNYPLQNHQNKIFQDFGVNTRQYVKDKFRPTWQDPMDQSSFMPFTKDIDNLRLLN
jgi:hypothetical protein